MLLTKSKPGRLLAAVTAAAALTFSACNAGSNLNDQPAGSTSPGASASAVTITAFNGQTGSFQKNFNPFSPGVVNMINGPIFETMFYYNQLKPIDQKPVPVLGQSFQWNDKGTELTVTLQKGVKWSDGEPFTANDVAFTFNLIQKTPELNTTGLSATAKATDDTTVVLSFKKPSFAEGPSALGRTYIVPQHLWKDIKKPSTDPIAKPVGTGPFTLASFTGESYLLKANPNYWQPGKPAIGGVRVISLSGNQAATDKWLAGQIDYMSAAIPELDKLTANKQNLTYTNTGTSQAALFACANAALGCKGVQTDPAVRKALFYAMDREQLSNLAFFKLGSAISPAFALPERDKAFIDPTIPVAPWQGQPDQAKKVLEDAGYALNAKGIYEKDGKPLKMTLKVVSGWTDFITAVDTVKEQYKKIGIDIVPQQVSVNEWNDAKSTGKFELVIDSLGQGPAPDPYYVYNTFFGTRNTVKVGDKGNPYANSARFSDKEVDAALERAASTDDMEVKRQAYFTIQKKVADNLPYIPMLIGSSLTEYNTSKVTGFPTAENMYAYPMSWSAPDNAQVLMNIKPAEGR